MFGYVSWICGAFIAGCFLQPPRAPVQAHYHEPYYQQNFQPWHHHRPAPVPRRPVDLMSDIINDLGTRVLQQYVESGNVAFSPAGMGFILAALYEGSSSRSRQQVVDSLGLPRDRNVVRVGMRDIHRRLRTYLNPDGFLGGLNLNRENTSLRPDYENILRFYGFDLSIDLSNFTAENAGNFGLRGSSTTSGMTATTLSASTNGSLAVGATTQTVDGSTTVLDTSVVVVSTTQEETVATVTPGAQTTITGDAAGVEAAATIVTTSPAATTLEATTTPATNAALISTTLPLTQPTAGNRAFLAADDGTTTTGLPTTTTLPTTTAMESSGMGDEIATVASPTVIPALIRRRRSRRRRRRSHDGYFSNYPDDGLWMQDLDFWADQPVLPTNERDATDLQFLVNGCDIATVPAATYTTVLPFAYFPSLKAVALEFPLDNPRYNVLLFMPTEKSDTSRLAHELAGQNLRLLRKQLQPTWLRATIPSFMLRGFVTLTPYLQRLGIRDVFEPRLADLSPMTPDQGIYARDVQQSIAVNIRNYMKPDPNAMNVNPENRNPNINMNPNPPNMNTTPMGQTANGAAPAGQNGNGAAAPGQNGNGAAALGQNGNGAPPADDPPVYVPPPRDVFRFNRPVNGLGSDRPGIIPFTAEHPFLFFIIDSETSVALIAGRIDDPLNSRIL